MINLFNIPNYKIDTSKFSNLLHDKIVTEFEQNFAEYVGAKYAVSFNSASSALFLLSRYLKYIVNTVKFNIPSILPPVVANSIINSGNYFSFVDDIDWIGSCYELKDENDLRIVDSAQKIDKNQYENSKKRNTDLFIYSFYPTKPVGSCDGGIIVSNDDSVLSELRILSINGTTNDNNSWNRRFKYVGHKMYMNSIQAYIANENLKKLGNKKLQLKVVREIYNKAFNLYNSSDHLYQIEVKGDRNIFIEKAKKEGITIGIHYYPLHKMDIYSNYQTFELPLSENFNKVSIPFHENLTDEEIDKVINFVYENNKGQ